MTLIILRSAIVFFLLLVIIRLMGKRQIGEMQPFELVITLLIADLACIPMADSSIPLLYGVVAVVTLYVLHELVTLLDLKFSPIKTLVSGKPSLVVNKNGIDGNQLKRNRLDVSDLIESLRTAGYFSLDAVDYALYESNGIFSALPKADYEKDQDSLPVVVIEEGKFDEKNLSIIDLDKDFFLKILRERGIGSEKRLLVMTVSGKGKVYLQRRGEKYTTFQISLPEGKEW